jgi:hypothetical protein
MNENNATPSTGKNAIYAQIKQRISIPWLWRYHNLPGDPIPGRRCHSPFYDDRHADFFISRDGHIRSVSIREPGQVKGTRLFELASILSYIERIAANSKAAARGEGAPNGEAA